MLQAIKEKYQIYNAIFNKIPDDEQNRESGLLLENSLYLSAFTVFEGFLNSLVEQYVEKVCSKGITFLELSEGYAFTLFMKDEARINNLFKEKNRDKFKKYLNYLKEETISKERLRGFMASRYLHLDKLDSYFKDLFEQIMGDKNFLYTLKFEVQKEAIESMNENLQLQINVDAYTFLSQFIAIRNQIAHGNQKYRVEGFYTFQKVTDVLLLIMEEMVKSYEKHTNFTYEVDENILG